MLNAAYLIFEALKYRNIWLYVIKFYFKASQIDYLVYLLSPSQASLISLVLKAKQALLASPDKRNYLLTQLARS